MTEQSLICRECEQMFSLTAREQEFLARRGSTGTPTRCRACRAVRRASRQTEPTSAAAVAGLTS
jgi:hypothetical protein